jgi:DNA-directed RNA polymerase subunit RPC12/RpoP
MSKWSPCKPRKHEWVPANLAGTLFKCKTCGAGGYKPVRRNPTSGVEVLGETRPYKCPLCHHATTGRSVRCPDCEGIAVPKTERERDKGGLLTDPQARILTRLLKAPIHKLGLGESSSMTVLKRRKCVERKVTVTWEITDVGRMALARHHDRLEEEEDQ